MVFVLIELNIYFISFNGNNSIIPPQIVSVSLNLFSQKLFFTTHIYRVPACKIYAYTDTSYCCGFLFPQLHLFFGVYFVGFFYFPAPLLHEQYFC